MTKTFRASLHAFLAAPVLLSAAFGSVPASAQTTAPAGQAPVGLDLSADQRAKAASRRAQFEQQVAALRADPKMSLTQKQAKYKAMLATLDGDMLAILTPAQRVKVLKQRQIDTQFKASVAALQANKTLTDTQKKARYAQLVESTRNASLALLTPTQRVDALKRISAGEQAQQLNQQLQKTITPPQAQKLAAIAASARTSMQAVIADKTLSDPAKTAKINAMRQDALSQDMALLTSSQRALYARIQALVSAPPAH